MKMKFNFFLLLMTVFVSMSSARAQELSSYEIALNEFEDLLRAEIKKDRIPKQTNPKVAALLNVLTDVEGQINAKNQKHDDILRVMEVCTRTHKILFEYIMFAIRNDPKLPSIAINYDYKELEKLMDKSYTDSQPEIWRLESSVLICQRKTVSLLDSFSKALLSDDRPEWFSKTIFFMRRSMNTVYLNSVRRALDKSLPENHRLKLLADLANTAVLYSSIFTPEIRADIVQRVEQVKGEFQGDSRVNINQIVEKMSDSTCQGLCTY